MARGNCEALQLGKVHAPEKGFVEVKAVLLKGLDQLLEELLTLLVP
jgi:hypothetical protein